MTDPSWLTREQLWNFRFWCENTLLGEFKDEALLVCKAALYAIEAKERECPECYGKGYVHDPEAQAQMGDKGAYMVQDCPACNGTGRNGG